MFVRVRVLDSPKAICKVHENQEASASCERCGDFACDLCLEHLCGETVCEACVQHENLRDLDRFQEQLRGVRDAFVWTFGLCGILIVVPWMVTVASFLESGGGQNAGLVVGVLTVYTWLTFGLHLSYLMLKRWARTALFIAPIMGMPSLLLIGHSAAIPVEWMGVVGVYGAIHGGLVFAAQLSPRNKLAFNLAVQKEELQDLLRVYSENRGSQLSLVAAILGFFFPPLLLVSLILSGVALGRCGPESWPVAKGRSYAYLGLSVSMVGLMTWALLMTS